MLPGSGLTLRLGEASSADELFTLESPLPARLVVLDLGRRVARTSAGAPVDWDRLPATDVDALALELHHAWLGDTVSARGECPAPGCREPIDITFSAAGYLDHHRPRPARGTIPDEPPGWYRLNRSPVRLRIPLVADLCAALEAAEPLTALTARCVRPAGITRAQAQRVDRALAALSPPLDGELGGTCPECGAGVRLTFTPCAFVVSQLRGAFEAIYAETHLLAASYGWEEAAILRLPRARRRRYAELASRERTAA